MALHYHTIHEGDLPSNLSLTGDIAVDTETMGLNFVKDRLCLVQLCDEVQNIHLVQISKGQKDAPNLQKLLEDSNREIIFHYARFDMMMLQHWLGINIQNVFCTKIASKIARSYTDSHGLKSLIRELTGINISKQMQSSDWGEDKLTSEQKEYAINDVIFLHGIRDKLISKLLREDNLELVHKIIEFLPVRVQLDLMGLENLDIFSH